MKERLTIVVGGFLGLLPAGGVAWDYVQYPVGLADLGHDVYYIEDTRLWPVYQAGGSGTSCAPNVRHLGRVMSAFGLGDRWAYRDEVSGECFGMSLPRVLEVCARADVFLNISCATALREEYLRIPARVLVDSDPMFTQIQYATEQAFTEGVSGMRRLIDAHSHLFTFGENIGRPGCRIPDCGRSWIPTRQPVCLRHWPVTPAPAGSYTTVMNWTAGKRLAYEGETWGQKDIEFRRFLDVPRRTPGIPLALAVTQTTGDPFSPDEVRSAGWTVLDPNVCARDWTSYRDFLQASRGEFSVAKETYVKARTGWFSCRSACYLAAGRPVVTQDTGWSERYPTGRGLLAFDDPGTAAEALLSVERDHAAHARAAREIAEEFFDSGKVLSSLLNRLGAGST